MSKSESEVYTSLIKKIDLIIELVKQSATSRQPCVRRADRWLDNTEACKRLGVSPRTLQRYRSRGQVTYSIRRGRTCYRQGEIRRISDGRVIKRKEGGSVGT